jgi:hypothetical protein
LAKFFPHGKGEKNSLKFLGLHMKRVHDIFGEIGMNHKLFQGEGER